MREHERTTRNDTVETGVDRTASDAALLVLMPTHAELCVSFDVQSTNDDDTKSSATTTERPRSVGGESYLATADGDDDDDDDDDELVTTCESPSSSSIADAFGSADTVVCAPRFKPSNKKLTNKQTKTIETFGRVVTFDALACRDEESTAVRERYNECPIGN